MKVVKTIDDWVKLPIIGKVFVRMSGISHMLTSLWRRSNWFLENQTLAHFGNQALATLQFMGKSTQMKAFPIAVKIDISPLCNLSCTVCVHAHAHGNPDIENQRFNAKQKMNVADYTSIIQQIKGKSSAVSLYYLGDPLVHPDLDEMSGIAYKAGLNVHVSTNFSFVLSDARLEQMVKSGLTHLTVCVDGLSQEKYQKTRVGGKIALVLDNLTRLMAIRKRLGAKYPKVEVQFIKFQHNVDELDAAMQKCMEIGVDSFTPFWGNLGNYTDANVGKYAIRGPKKNTWIPQCHWAHYFMVIKYNGDVIPCCNHRLGEQYAADKSPLAIGNVFTTSVAEVWNSPAYQNIRAVVSNPSSADRGEKPENHFCHGCAAIDEVDTHAYYKDGADYTWEELYVEDEKKRVIPLKK